MLQLARLCVLVALVVSTDPIGNARAGQQLVTSQPFWVEELATGLKNPASMAWLPDGSILIAERNGGLRLLRGGVLSKPLAGTPPSFQNLMNGLKEVVLDPAFATNRTLYLLLVAGSYEAHYAAVYRARLDGEALQDVERIFRSQDEISGPMQIAGRMIVMQDGTLLIGITDDNYHKQYTQRLDSHIGKMVRINRDGTVPADNPFREKADALPEIWSYGHRVPNGLYQDPVTGDIWETDPGPKGGDELNQVKRAANYGWPITTWGFDYTDGQAGPHQTAPNIEAPVVVWTPSGTPAGVTRYRGSAYPFWDGDYFVGMLSGKWLERVRLSNGTPVLQERLLMDLEERIRDVRVGPDGYLYVLTDHDRGRLLRLMPDSPPSNARVAHKLERPTVKPFELDYGDPVKGEAAFKERCASCHSIGTKIAGGSIGPDLEHVYARKAGSQPGYPYSSGMARLPQEWDFISLNIFMSGPTAYVPGTRMSTPPVDDLRTRIDIAGFLKKVAGQ